MTFSAARTGTDPHQITVAYTYGPVTVHMTENSGHLRAFWHQLGVLLEEAEEAK
jgi:hypothetical protein